MHTGTRTAKSHDDEMTRSSIRSISASGDSRTPPDPAAILSWFKSNGRDFPWRRNKAPRYRYRQIVSEVLLRRTRAATVDRIYYKFFRDHFPTWKSLAVARQSDLEELLFELGMWRERARTLPLLAKAVVEMDYRLPAERSALEKLPGVGLYVASAILLFRHGQSEPLLDRNMSRVLCRFHGLVEPVDLRHDRNLYDLASTFVTSIDRSRVIELNWAVLDLAALVCKPRPAIPSCHACPLQSKCKYVRGQAPEHVKDNPRNN